MELVVVAAAGARFQLVVLAVAQNLKPILDDSVIEAALSGVVESNLQ